MQFFSLDQLLDEDHAARTVWEAVCRLDLSRWLVGVKAVQGHVGRDATDPRLLLALWIYATLQGVGSARQLARLSTEHVAYRWLCGGVSLNYHTLADFRSQSGEQLDGLLTQVVAALLAEGLATMKCVAQDGMRVRASAGKASFRRRGRLEEFREQARRQLEALRQLAEESPEALTTRQGAARRRAAAEREARMAEALRHCEEIQEKRRAAGRPSRQKEARASTTDPEARVMKFPDGGYRPGYNVQFATDTGSGIIVGVDVTNEGNDQGQMSPMVDQLAERYEEPPAQMLVDGGFASLQEVEKVETDHACQVYSPLRDEEKTRAAGQDPYAPKRGDSQIVADWRARMGTAAAQAIYKLRAQTAEWVNALCRNRNLWQFRVRGRARCRGTTLLYALAHNLQRAAVLRAEAAMRSS
jgi:transposase